MSTKNQQQQARTALAQQNATDDKAAADKAPRFDGLIGSNTQPETFVVDGVELMHADLVTMAFSAAGMGRDEWNALTQAERETRIAAARTEIEAEAEAEAKARAQREATRAVLAAKRSEQAPPASAASLPAADQPQAMVYDTTARVGEPRSHEIVIGKHPDGAPIIRRYKLSSDVPTTMPLDHAMKFLVDKAFRVIDPDGAIMTPVERITDADGPVRLKHDQVVAKYEDLNLMALLKHAKLLPGSEHLGTNSLPEEIVAFILANKPKRNIGVSRGSEGIQEDAEAGEILDIKIPTTA